MIPRIQGSDVPSSSEVNNCKVNNDKNRIQKFLDIDSGPGTMLRALPHLTLLQLYDAVIIIISILWMKTLRLRGTNQLAQVAQPKSRVLGFQTEPCEYQGFDDLPLLFQESVNT